MFVLYCSVLLFQLLLIFRSRKCKHIAREESLSEKKKPVQKVKACDEVPRGFFYLE